MNSDLRVEHVGFGETNSSAGNEDSSYLGQCVCNLEMMEHRTAHHHIEGFVLHLESVGVPVFEGHVVCVHSSLSDLQEVRRNIDRRDRRSGLAELLGEVSGSATDFEDAGSRS